MNLLIKLPFWRVPGKYKEAFKIFSRMQEAGVQPDKATCNILIEKFCKAGQTWAVTQILLFMKDNFLVLRYPVYLEALQTLNVAGESDILLRQVNPHFKIELSNKKEIVEFEETASGVYFTTDRGLVLYFLAKQNFFALDCLLTGMIPKNTRLDSVIISRIIEVNCAHCRINGALLAFEYSVKMGINIERTDYLALLGVFIRTNSFPKVADIVEKMVRAGISLGTYLGALLIYRLGCARKLGSASKVFRLWPDDQKGTAAYTALISAYFSAGNVDKGLTVYKNMRRKGIPPALGTYDLLLTGLEKKGRVCEAEMYRKEKKALHTDGLSETVSMDEKICNLLFSRNMVLGQSVA